MDEPIRIERILIATRGIMARRLVNYYRANGVESVLAFSEPDAEQAVLDEVDYDAYLSGRTVTDTYLRPDRVLGVAMDAACDALHPGSCFLAEHIGFHRAAQQANVVMIAPPLEVLERTVHRVALRELADRIGLARIPSSGVLGPDEDGVEAAARIGGPLYVKSVGGRALMRVERLEDVAEAVVAVRSSGRVLAGTTAIYLERAVEARRHISTTIVGDGVEPIVHLSWCDCSAERGRFTHIEECGSALVSPELADVLRRQVRSLADALQWKGVGRIRWAVTPDGSPYLLGVSSRLTTGFDLVEAVHDVVLVDAQHRIVFGLTLGWEQPTEPPPRHGIQLRLYHMDPEDGSRSDGVLERLELPSGPGIRSEAGVDVGTPCGAETEPLLAKITVTAPSRQAAIVRARAALGEVHVEGLSTNRTVLLTALEDGKFWEGTHDVRLLRT